MKRKDLPSLGTLVLFLFGCEAVGPNHKAPQPALGETWSALESNAEETSSAVTTHDADLSQWWKRFESPALDALVEEALQSNLDLREAASRVREARALWGVARGGLLPELNVDASYQRLRLSEQGQFPTTGATLDLYQAGFDASWEIDFFGGRRRELEAAQADADATVENLRDVRVSLLAEVARNYVELVGARTRLEIAKQNLEAQRKSADWARARFDSGWTTELDLSRAQALVSTTEAAIPTLEAVAQQTLHRLDVLLGRQPDSFLSELAEEKSIPKAPPEIPLGLPTDLLRRRPDLRRAERDLAAATARVGVASADLYPRFFLTGAYGTESSGSSNLFESASRSWSLGPSVRWALFQGGRIRAQIEANDARAEQAALRFEKTLLASLLEVEDAIISHSREQRRRRFLSDAVVSQRRAVELAEQRYGQGLVDFLIVLDAQRSLYAAQDSLVQSEQAVATNAIALYKAVGGGWDAAEGSN